ncbi:LacI family DNA-binding transcriptional regulator [Actinocorallia longicatena]|uniref:LacI family DNA-binding transcriptional regulator n=1 Tax=Actinocorallia longicatena TaxID=111803 RepID=A0ABP6QPN3_9ACTN
MTISEVARAAEVSTATVSNALNGTGRLSEATRRRVREVADRLGYLPNPAGRALRTGRTRVLGLAVTTYGGHSWNFSEVAYYARLITSATAAAHRHGYALTVLPAALTDRGWRTLAVDGVILLDSPEGDPAVAALRSRGIPIAFDGRPWDLAPGESWVDNDHAATTLRVLDHLASQGARRIALLAGHATDHYTRSCVEAYERYVDEPLIGHIEEDDTEGRVAAGRLLAAGADAVYGLFDGCGRAVLSAARALGLEVPADVLLVTCSEDPAYGWTSPPVSTVSLDPAGTVDLAVTALAGTLAGGPATVHAGRPTLLTVRASSVRTVPVTAAGAGPPSRA